MQSGGARNEGGELRVVIAILYQPLRASRSGGLPDDKR